MSYLIVNAARSAGTIRKTIYGQFSEHLGRCIYGGIADQDGALRPAVLQALKTLHIPVLRWPGGCFADTYHWRDGIGPRSERKTIINTNWGGVTENNAFGTHEFLSLCEQLGCEAYLSGNVGSGTVQEFSDWVEYCNMPGVSPMADLRRRNGREAPFGVRYWGIGNEAWGCGGTMRAEYYADLCRQYVDNEDIVAVLGDFTSTACMADAPIVKEAEMAILSPTASNPAFTEMNDCTFGIIGKQDADSRYYAHYVLQEYAGVDKVGIIYIESDWGNAAMSNFVDEAGKIGLNIVEMASFVQDEKDFSSIITKMKAANPDHIAIMDQGATSQIINQIRTSGWDVSLSTNGPGTSQQLIDLCGENCEGLLLTTPFFFDTENEKEMAWRDEFTERAGFAPTVHSVNAYDCALLISEAIRQCGDDITRENVRDKLAAIDFSGGLTGQIKFDETGSLDRRYIICEIVDGEYVKRAGFDYPEQVAAGK